MRIFQVIEAQANLLVPTNQTWYRNLYEPLIDLGHEVVLFPAEKAGHAMLNNDKKTRANFSVAMVNSFKKEHSKSNFDLFFSYFKDGMVEPRAIDEIRNLGVPTCNFSCNNIHQFDLVDEISPHFDYSLHSEKDARKKFLNIGANPIWWPMASNPKYFKPYSLPRTLPVSFVGANYDLRAQHIAYLLDNNIDVHVYGPCWQSGSRSPIHSFIKRYIYIYKALFSFTTSTQYLASAFLYNHDLRRHLASKHAAHLHPPVSDEELIHLYSKSQISLGFLEVFNQHDPTKGVKRHIHLREFEAPMSGALYLTGFLEELAEFFEPNKEMIMYHNEEEMLDKISYYLTHSKEANAIRDAGYKRALAEHTYHIRFNQLFSQIGLKNK